MIAPDDPPNTERSEGRKPRAASPQALSILLVEDEFFLAWTLEEDLRDNGFHVIGPCTSLAQALQAIDRVRFDLAILDVNLNGEMVYPLADELLARRVPFLFLTGYGGVSLPERFRVLPRVAKPYETSVLLREIRRVLHH
jgi:DNA-binding response OmpR family regulator